MLRRMTCRQLQEWKVAWQMLGGWGSRRSELEMGIIASTIANAAPRRRRRPFRARQFMPTFGRKGHGRKQTEAEIFASVDAFLEGK